MNPVEVRIPRAKWEWLGHDVHRGVFLLEQLRSMGAPVVGAIWPTGVETGCLVHYVAGDDLV